MFYKVFEEGSGALESGSSAVGKMAPIATPSKATHNENIQVKIRSFLELTDALSGVEVNLQDKLYHF